MSVRTLLLMRHAKSASTTRCSDHDRPLNDRGMLAAPRMGRWLNANGLSPELVLTSTATRACTTASLVAAEQEVEPVVTHVEGLYLPGTGDIVEALGAVPDETCCVLVVGHNPGFEHAVHVLTGQYEAMPTAAVAVIDLDVDGWSDLLVECSGRLRTFLRVKELPE